MRYVLIADESTELAAVDTLYRLASSEHEVVLVVQMDAPRAPAVVRRRNLWDRLRAPRVVQDHTHVGIESELHIRGIQARSLADTCEDLEVKWWRAGAVVDDLLELEIQQREPDVILSLCEDSTMASLAPLAAEGIVTVGAAYAGRVRAADANRWSLFAGKPPTIYLVRRPAWDEGAGIVSSLAFPVHCGSPVEFDRLENKTELELVSIASSALDRIGQGDPLEESPPEALPPALGEMALPLREVLQIWLKNGATPVAGTERGPI